MPKYKKILQVIVRNLINIIAYIDTPTYMKLKVRYLKSIGIRFTGEPDFISPSVYFDGVDYSLITIGKNCVISFEVVFLTHDYSILRGLESIGVKGVKKRIEQPITVGDNCFIGERVSLLPGTTIGNNVIIGACSVVKGNIASDSIVIGNPCKYIKNTKEWAEEYCKKYDIKK